jgi:hypothetical protein
MRHRRARKRFVRPWDGHHTQNRRNHQSRGTWAAGDCQRLALRRLHPSVELSHAIIPFDHGQRRGVGDWPVESALREYTCTCMGFNAVQRAHAPSAALPLPRHMRARARTPPSRSGPSTAARHLGVRIRPSGRGRKMSSAATWRSMATPRPIQPAVSTTYACG